MDGKKILIVDDEKNLQEMVKDILCEAGFTIVTADNGVEGLKQLYKESPDLVILDCQMPEKSGLEVLEEIRRDPLLINLPVIMLTVNNTENDEVMGLRLGIDDYMTKPFKNSVLLARVRAVLERKALSLGANPLTLLAGNIAINFEIERRLRADSGFALLYIDLNHFKSFNDRYGFERGDKIIKHTASILVSAVKEVGGANDFIGHVGGDDFVVVTMPDHYQQLSENIIYLFDSSIKQYYDEPDRSKGFIVTENRQNQIQEFPLMGISIAVVCTDHTKISHAAQLGEIAAGLKKLAKKENHSAYVVERRKE